MIEAAKSAVPFFEGPHFYYGAGAAVAVLTFLKITGTTKWLKVRWTAYRNWSLLNRGRPANDLQPEVVPLIKRLTVLDKGMKDQVAITTKLDNGQKVIVQTLTEHGDDISEIKVAVSDVRDSVTTMVRKIDKLFPNGETTNEPGDLLSRTAKAVGAFLPDPQPPVHDRRSTDNPDQAAS
jgi:hypothetical protein